MRKQKKTAKKKKDFHLSLERCCSLLLFRSKLYMALLMFMYNNHTCVPEVGMSERFGGEKLKKMKKKNLFISFTSKSARKRVCKRMKSMKEEKRLKRKVHDSFFLSLINITGNVEIMNKTFSLPFLSSKRGNIIKENVSHSLKEGSVTTMSTPSHVYLLQIDC